jgi:hypothetical protein
MIFFLENILSFVNLVIINFKILFIKVFKKKKIVLFYHPKKKLTKNNLSFIVNHFSKEKEFYFFYVSTIKIRKKNFFLVKQTYLKFILGVDLFLSNNICDKFTLFSQKIYIHHDIYDTPLVERSKEKALFKKLIKYNFIVVASKESKKVFEKILGDYSGIKIVVFRYIKIDYIQNKIKSIKKSKNFTVMLAPTNFLSFPKISIQSKLDELITKLISNKFDVIYRPHPSNIDEKKIVDLKKRYEENNFFNFDKSPDYLDSYANSDCLLTDLSGTAYTYAITTNKPVIFFGIKDFQVNKLKYNDLNYFKNQDKIGWKINNSKKLIQILKNKRKLYSKKEKIRKFSKTFWKSKKLDLKYFLKHD